MRVQVLAEQMQICEGFLPVNMGTASNPGDWVSLKHYQHLSILLFTAVGTASEPATITVEQATAVAGTAAKALNFTTIWKKQAAVNLQGTGLWTKVTQAAANTYALGSGSLGDNAALVLIEFNDEDLDVGGNFDCVRGTVADVGTGPTLGAMLYILSNPRYTPPPSAIVD